MSAMALRHESPAGHWELVSRAPHPALRGHVRRYCGYVERMTAPQRRREVISGDVVLIVAFGPSMTIRYPLDPRAPEERRTSFLVGLHAPLTVTEHDGVADGVQIDLTPLGAHLLLGLPMHEVAGRVVDLDEALGPLGAELPERLAEAPGWEARFSLLDATLARRALAAAPPSPDVARAWHRLAETRGRLPVGALAAELGCSRRHLAARFREQVGVTPKAAARVLRFHHALERLKAGERWADIAYDCGYYDQPHMNREFREFAGASPSQLAAAISPAGLGVAA
jgi:AraC-like DNA-binding protein